MSISIINVTLSKSITSTSAQFLRRFCFIPSTASQIQSIADGAYQVVNASNFTEYVQGTTNETYKWLKSFFTSAGESKEAVIFNPAGTNASDRLKALEAFIQEGTYPCYKYSLGQDLVKDAYFATLSSAYADVSKSCYFSFVCEDGIDPAKSTTIPYSNWSTKKSVMAFYKTLSDSNYNIDGLITGIMASSQFDISTSTKMKSLDLVSIPVTATDLNTTMLNALENAPAVFGTPISGQNVIYNSKMADNTFWYYYYCCDILKYTLISEFNTLLINSANNTNSAIPYNDNGIRSVSQKFANVLRNLMEMWVVNRFAKSYDSGTDTLKDINSVNAISFEEYKNANKENYSNGIYGGLSAYVEIMGFIRKVNISVNLG